jgi:hypothetical protein
MAIRSIIEKQDPLGFGCDVSKSREGRGEGGKGIGEKGNKGGSSKVASRVRGRGWENRNNQNL